MSFGDERDPDIARDPLDTFPLFIEAVRARLEAGRAAYGDRSFDRPTAELVRELQQEALDLAGWGFILFDRLRRLDETAKRVDDDPRAALETKLDEMAGRLRESADVGIDARPVRGDW